MSHVRSSHVCAAIHSCIITAAKGEPLTVTTDFGNQKASHYLVFSQQWPMMDCRISNAPYSEQVLRVLNILSRVMRCSSRGEPGLSNVLEIVSKVYRTDEYISALRGVISIQQHHLGCNSSRKQCAYNHLSALIRCLNT